MPLLQITAGCTAARFPVLFFAALEQGKNSHVLLSQEKTLTWTISNDFTPKKEWILWMNGLIQVKWIFKYIKTNRQEEGADCVFVTLTLSLEMGVRSSLAEERVKSKVSVATVSELATPAALSVTQQEEWFLFGRSYSRDDGGSGSFNVSVICNIQEVRWIAFHF